MFDILGLIKKFIPDQDKAKALEAKIAEVHSDALKTAVEQDSKVRIAEIQSKGIQAKWRPLAAISVFLCLFLYWFIRPLCMIIIGLFNLEIFLPQLPELPLEFYGLATAFISIYAFGRSMDKRR